MKERKRARARECGDEKIETKIGKKRDRVMSRIEIEAGRVRRGESFRFQAHKQD